MKKVFIYTLTDPLTNEVRYVGKTTNLLRRLNAHINRSKKYKYHSARWINSIIEKGLKPIMSVIEECDEKNWEDKEVYWINYYRGLFDLTNILDGGGHSATYGRLGKPWSEEQRINNRKTRLGMKVNHTEEGNKKRVEGIRRYYNQNKKQVYQYDLNGCFIKEWSSAVDVEKELGVKHSNITKVCKCLGKQAGGFMWSYKIENLPPYERNLYMKKVLQIDSNDSIVNQFDSIKEASLVVGISKTAIVNCLTGKSKSSGGFKWKYKY